MMPLPAVIPTKLPNSKPAILPSTGGSTPPPDYDTGLRLGSIFFTDPLQYIQPTSPSEGDSFLVEARNLTTGAYSTYKYEFAEDGMEANPGFVTVTYEEYYHYSHAAWSIGNYHGIGLPDPAIIGIGKKTQQ